MLTRLRLAVAAGLVLALATGVPAQAQVPTLLSIPPELPIAIGNPLTQERGRLQGRLEELRRQVQTLAARGVTCINVKKDSADDAACAQVASGRRAYIADVEAFNARVVASRSVGGPVKIDTQGPDGAVALEAPTWDCYCIRRWVTRANGPVRMEVLRTPEQQRAFEAFNTMDQIGMALTRMRQKDVEHPIETAEKIAVKVMLGEIVSRYAMFAYEVRQVAKGKSPLYSVPKFGDLFEFAAKVHAWKQATKELRETAEAFPKAIEQWVGVNERAKTVPAIESLLAQPYTLTFTSRPGGTVAIVTRSADSVSRGVTPPHPVTLPQSWDGR